MTAPAITAARADLITDLDEWITQGARIAGNLLLAGYGDNPQLNVDRAKLGRATVWASEVMGSLALLGTDPEARD